MDEMMEKLEEALREEAEDAEKYKEMASQAKQMFPHCGYGSILLDISREEMVHHRHLQEIINDMRRRMPEQAGGE